MPLITSNTKTETAQFSTQLFIKLTETNRINTSYHPLQNKRTAFICCVNRMLSMAYRKDEIKIYNCLAVALTMDTKVEYLTELL